MSVSLNSFVGDNLYIRLRLKVSVAFGDEMMKWVVLITKFLI